MSAQQIAVITRAARGIGRKVAADFAGRGYASFNSCG